MNGLTPLKKRSLEKLKAIPPWAWLLLAALVLYSANLGGYPLFDVDEPRYAETAREMLTTPGDWITPHFNWLIRFDKPPLLYWWIAGFYQLFGVSEWAARLPSALSALGITGMLAWTGQRLLPQKPDGLAMGMIFATMLIITVLSHWAITDMLLAAAMTGCWLSLILASTDTQAKQPTRWFLVTGLFAALGSLTKGPVAVALPGLTWLIYLACFQRNWFAALKSLDFWLGIGLWLVLALPWYLAVTLANPETFIQQFFFLHNVERFASTVSGHQGPFWFYLPVMIIGLFPWAFVFWPLGKTLWLSRKNWPALVQYAFIWFGVVFCFFSVANTKLLTYVLPGFPALAILLGWAWLQQDTPHLGKPLSLALLIGFNLVTLAILFLQPVIPDFPNQAAVLATLPWVFLGAAFIFLIVFLRHCSPVSPEKSLAWLAGGMACVYVLLFQWAVPCINQIFQGEIQHYAQLANQAHVPMATYETKKTSLVFYTQRKVYFITADEVETSPHKLERATLKTLYVVVKNSDKDSFQAKHPKAVILNLGQTYSLFELHHISEQASDNQ